MGRSADLKVGNFPEGTTNCDIAKAIVGHFSADNIKVLSIQQCANKIARVTFDDKTACEIVRLRGELDMDGVKVPVVPPPPPPPNWVNVNVYNYPYDAPSSYIEDTLSFFGKIHSVRFQHWTNLPEVATGTRVVRINLSRSIPRFVRIDSYRCKVWYRGQPVYCDICKEKSHTSPNCPYKGKCLSCKEIGHVARKCPNVCFKCRGDHASDSCPSRRGWERAPLDVDDFQSVDSDDGTGGVVVGGAVGADLNSALGDEAGAHLDSASGNDAGTDVSVSDAAGSTGISDADGHAVFGIIPVDFLAPCPPLSPLPSAPLDDERFNQLDEYQTQSDSLGSQSALVVLTDVVDNACGACESSDCAAISATSSERSDVQPRDATMAEPSAARKRDASELVSSDDSRSRSRSRARKSSRVPAPHLPSEAGFLARSRSSSSSKSARSSSRPKS